MIMQFDKTLGKHITSLSYLLSKQLNKSLSERKSGITSDQFRLLTNLWRKDGITQQKLAIYIGRDRASVARMITILENSNIVTRINHETDKRVNLIYLTKKGRELEPIAWQCVQESLNIMTKGFNSEETLLFEQLLIRASDNLKPVVCATIKSKLSK